jgi:hypothetical protein
VDPLGPVLLQFNLTGWDYHIIPSARGFYGGTGAAPFLTVRSQNGSTLYYSGFGPCSGIGDGKCGWASEDEGANASNNWNLVTWYGAYMNDYVASVPIVSSSQYVHWDLQIFANDASTGPAFPVSRVSPHPYWSASPLTADIAPLGERTTVSDALWSSAYQTTSYGEVWLNYSVQWEQPKATTYLIVPSRSSPLSHEPWGLKRYAGEPDFDLLTVDLTNTTGPLTLGGISDAGATGTTSVTLRRGLNNILVPRGLFLYSPLGQAILNSTNDSFTPARGSGLSFCPTYWWGRSHEGVTWPWDPSYIRVVAPSNESISDPNLNASTQKAFGGVPGNPAVEPGNESRQVQAIVWANVTTSWELQNLLGGLLLNSSGGVANNLVNATYSVGTLDLPYNVLAMLANASIRNNGSYPAPEYNPSFAQSAGGFGAFLSEIWNTIAGVASYFVSGVEMVASVIWSATIAAQAYIAGLVNATVVAVSRGLQELATQSETALKAVESAMEWALTSLVDSAFSFIVGGITKAMTSYVQGIWSDWRTLWSEFNSTGTVTKSSATGFLNQTFGGPFLVALGIMTAVAVALTIIQALSLGLGFITDSLVELIAGAIASVAIGYVASVLPSDLLSSSAVMFCWGQLNGSASANERSGSGGGGRTASPAIVTFFSLLATAVGFAIAGYQLWSDAPKAVDTVQIAMTDTWAVDEVVVEPIVSAALGVLSLALATDALLFNGTVRLLLDGVGLFFGLLAAAYTFWCIQSPLSRSELEFSGQLAQAQIGLGFDIAGAADGAAQLLLDYV